MRVSDLIWFTFFFFFGIKFIYFYLAIMYNDDVQLVWNFSQNTILTGFFIIILWLRQIFVLVVPYKTGTLFSFTLFVWYEILFIKKFGLFHFFSNKYLNAINCINAWILKYWKFRKKLSPRLFRCNLKYSSIFKKYVKRSSQRSDNYTIFCQEFEDYKKRSSGHEKKKKDRFKPKAEKRTPADRLLAPWFVSPHLLNHYDDIQRGTPRQFIKFTSRKQKSQLTGLISSLLRFSFIIVDFIILGYSYFFTIFPKVVWKPLNIRLPYFRKINKNRKYNNRSKINKINNKCISYIQSI